MDLTVIKAKIASGVLPRTNGVGAREARYVTGVCAGCDVTFRAEDVGVQLFVSGNRRRLLHPDCYVMWSEACAETSATFAVCKVCGNPIKGGTPRYRLGGGLASVHVECRDMIKPHWPRPSRQSSGESSQPAA